MEPVTCRTRRNRDKTGAEKLGFSRKRELSAGRSFRMRASSNFSIAAFSLSIDSVQFLLL
jgi:hypothetical protein